MIGHVVVLFGFCHRPDSVRSFMIAQFHFQRRPYLYDQSRSYIIRFSSQLTLDLIVHETFVSFSDKTIIVQSVTILFYLVFVFDDTQFNRSRQFSFVFGIEYTYTISHVIVLSCFHHRPHSIKQIPLVQFRFRRRSNLYNWLHRCPVYF